MPSVNKKSEPRRVLQGNCPSNNEQKLKLSPNLSSREKSVKWKMKPKNDIDDIISRCGYKNSYYKPRCISNNLEKNNEH